MLKANHIGCITALKDSCEHPDDDAGVGGFAPAPASWHYLGSSAAIAARPHRFDLPGGQSFVAFRPPGQPVVVLGARCSHMGADLSRGCVRAGRIVCPLHGWEYAADGKCARIPCGDAVPEFARQRVHPVAEVGGQVFFFNGAEARFPMPFFDGVNGDDLHAARAFDIHEDVPWHLVIANGFDRQHFEKTHERTLLAEPVVDAPSPFARRISLQLKVEGSGWADRLTRAFGGNASRMTITAWCGSLAFVTAEFPAVRTRGIVAVQPLENGTSRIRVIVWVERSRGLLGRVLLDGANAAVRRQIVRAFFQDDLGKLTGTAYRPERMVPSDETLAEYLDWLQNIHR